MPLLSEEERQRCLEHGLRCGSALLHITDREVLLYRPPPSGSLRSLMQASAAVFTVLGVSALLLAVLAPPKPEDIWVPIVGCPLFLGMGFFMLRTLGHWAELRLTPHEYAFAEVRDVSVQEKTTRGPLSELAAIQTQRAGHGHTLSLIHI